VYIYIFFFYQTAPANEVDRRPSKKTGKYQNAADNKKDDPTDEDQQQSSRAAAAAAAGKCNR